MSLLHAEIIALFKKGLHLSSRFRPYNITYNYSTLCSNKYVKLKRYYSITKENSAKSSQHLSNKSVYKVLECCGWLRFKVITA